LVRRGVSPDLGVLSDGARQFVVFVHAACWVHAERLLVKLIPHNEEHRAAIEKIRTNSYEFLCAMPCYEFGMISASMDDLRVEAKGCPHAGECGYMIVFRPPSLPIATWSLPQTHQNSLVMHPESASRADYAREGVDKSPARRDGIIGVRLTVR
jgi:hypothetical protein